MTDPGEPLYTSLSFNSPLSDWRAARLIESLGPHTGAHVVDIGCGWAELLLRLAASEPTVTATGIDSFEDEIEHGRANARARGLDDHVELICTDASPWRPKRQADVAICIGASHALGGTEPA